MSQTTSVQDAVRSAGRACAQQGAGIADTPYSQPHSATKAGALQ